MVEMMMVAINPRDMKRPGLDRNGRLICSALCGQPHPFVPEPFYRPVTHEDLV